MKDLRYTIPTTMASDSDKEHSYRNLGNIWQVEAIPSLQRKSKTGGPVPPVYSSFPDFPYYSISCIPTRATAFIQRAHYRVRRKSPNS